MFSITPKKALFWILLTLTIAAITWGIFRYLDQHPSTDDAYVQAHTINIAAQITGPVANIYVKDHELVKKGQLLFTIDSAPFEIAVHKAQAAVAAQQAALLLAQQNADRILKLVAIGQMPKASGDQAQSQLDSAKANLLADQAQLDSAKLDLQHTQVTAPGDGVLAQFLLQPGNNVVANTTLFMIIEQNNFWIDANFKETQLAYIRPGQSAKITLDMYPDHSFTGKVDAVSSASGAVFSLLPPENASGNWVKVTQRFPVKIVIQDPDPAYPLRAGATATATIDTNSHG